MGEDFKNKLKPAFIIAAGVIKIKNCSNKNFLTNDIVISMAKNKNIIENNIQDLISLKVKKAIYLQI